MGKCLRFSPFCCACFAVSAATIKALSALLYLLRHDFASIAMHLNYDLILITRFRMLTVNEFKQHLSTVWLKDFIEVRMELNSNVIYLKDCLLYK